MLGGRHGEPVGPTEGALEAVQVGRGGTAHGVRATARDGGRRPGSPRRSSCGARAGRPGRQRGRGAGSGHEIELEVGVGRTTRGRRSRIAASPPARSSAARYPSPNGPRTPVTDRRPDPVGLRSPGGRRRRRPTGRPRVRHPGHPRRRRPRPVDRRGGDAHHAGHDVRPDGSGRAPGFEYSRSGNPTRQALEQVLASLEGAGARLRLRVGPGRRGRRAAAARCPVNGSSSATTPTAARTGSSPRVHGPAGLRWTAADLTDIDGLARRSADTRHGVGGDADQPPAHVRRHRRRGRHRPRPRRPGGGRQHLRHPVPADTRSPSAPTSSCTRPPSTSAATPTWWAGRWRPVDDALAERIGFVQNAAGAVPARRSTATSCCGA